MGDVWLWRLQPLRALSWCLELSYGQKNLFFLSKVPSLGATTPRMFKQSGSSSISLPPWAAPVFLPARSSTSSLSVLRDRPWGGDSGGG